MQVWWNALRVEKPDEDPVARMTRLLEFADGKADRKKVDRIAELVNNLSPGAKDLGDGTSSTLMLEPLGVNDYGIAEAYRIAGAEAKAEEFYKKAIERKSVALRTEFLAPPREQTRIPRPRAHQATSRSGHRLPRPKDQ